MRDCGPAQARKPRAKGTDLDPLPQSVPWHHPRADVLPAARQHRGSQKTAGEQATQRRKTHCKYLRGQAKWQSEKRGRVAEVMELQIRHLRECCVPTLSISLPQTGTFKNLVGRGILARPGRDGVNAGTLPACHSVMPCALGASSTSPRAAKPAAPAIMSLACFGTSVAAPRPQKIKNSPKFTTVSFLLNHDLVFLYWISAAAHLYPRDWGQMHPMHTIPGCHSPRVESNLPSNGEQAVWRR